MHSFRIVVDNYSEGRLEAAWGLSILVETPGANILFDTGPSSNILESNLEALGIDPESIDCVVISHEHSDHASGLRFIASASPGIDVHVPQPSLEFFKKKFSGLEINFVGMGGDRGDMQRRIHSWAALWPAVRTITSDKIRK
jgi:7,8-dihydropterin-6-yl-methyl-4-(beta-D-ribofuranosyl)aminobenzene 5'-phosphate synthase